MEFVCDARSISVRAVVPEATTEGWIPHRASISLRMRRLMAFVGPLKKIPNCPVGKFLNLKLTASNRWMVRP